MNGQKTERNMGIELLRIVCMFFIVILHVLGQGGVLWEVKNFSAHYYVVWFLNMLVYSAVNTFAMISGYVGYQGRWRISKLMQLWLMVVLYGLIAVGSFSLINRENFQINLLKKAIMPFTQGEYWYISAYAGMFFLIPIMNSALQTISRRKLLACLLSTYGLYTVLPSIFHQDPFKLQYGYCVLWLCLLYLTGAYLAKYKVAEKVSKKGAILCYLAAAIVSFLGKTMSEYVTFRVFGETKFGYLFVYYTTPFMVFAAIGLLLCFSKIKIENKFAKTCVKKIAPTTLGIYVIHVQPYIFYQWIQGMTKSLAGESVAKMTGMIFVYAISVFIIAAAIELIRIRLFALLKVEKWCDRVEKWCTECYIGICQKKGIE